MRIVNWAEAPEGAVAFGYVGAAGKPVFVFNNGYQYAVSGERFAFGKGVAFREDEITIESVRPTISLKSTEWPETDERISAIAQSGNTGEHYPSPKHDSAKPRYDLLPPIAIDLMAQVMTFGAKKYKPEGWRTVDNAIQRYQAALLRHSFAMLRGEVLDPESGLPHAAHAMCCAAFIAELLGEK